MYSLNTVMSIFPGSESQTSTCGLDWREDALDRDLYIQTSTVTILAMDGRRRWLDIESLVSADMIHLMIAILRLVYHLSY